MRKLIKNQTNMIESMKYSFNKYLMPDWQFLAPEIVRKWWFLAPEIVRKWWFLAPELVILALQISFWAYFWQRYSVRPIPTSHAVIWFIILVLNSWQDSSSSQCMLQDACQGYLPLKVTVFIQVANSLLKKIQLLRGHRQVDMNEWMNIFQQKTNWTSTIKT